MPPPAAQSRLDLEGTWHVVATDFPMWTSGQRTAPRFTYANPRQVRGRLHLDDTVTYLQGGRERRIEGVDVEEAPGRFLWRGKGLLWLFRSRWEVVAAAGDGAWLALRFARTLATPAGHDVIARTPALDAAALARALAALGTPPLVTLPR